MRKNSIKNTRINGEVRRQLSDIIRNGIKDPRIHPLTSVTDVVVAPDLKTCRAYISVLGDADALQSTLEGLKSAEGYIRRELAHTVNLRNTPEIRFLPDTSIEYGVRMTGLIDQVVASDGGALREDTDEPEDEEQNGPEDEERNEPDDQEEE